MSFAAEKRLVLDMYAALDAAAPGAEADALSRYVTEDWTWKGSHPWNAQRGAGAVAASLWTPLRSAFTDIVRRPDIFLAGLNTQRAEPAVWVVQMGHLMGNFDAAWLGIRPTRRVSFVRYVEFHRIEAGRIAETASYIDIPGLFAQAGVRWMPAQTGGQMLTPGPATHDGVLLDDHDPAQGAKTQKLIDDMVADLVGDGVASSRAHLDRWWTPDMCWFGPAGIGSSTGREGYMRGHTGPFEAGLAFVRHNSHELRVSEGRFGGFFGYPSLTMKSTGGFMGLTASDREADMRIVDMYRREGDLLAENWIFIDLLHFMDMLGVDVLARLRATGALLDDG